MDFPSDDWTVFAADEFELATCRDPGILGVELMAQARANGRIIDHFKLVVGGTEELAVEFKMADLFNIRSPPEWMLVYKLQPADIKIRRNMSTSNWQDIRDLRPARSSSSTRTVRRWWRPPSWPCSREPQHHRHR